MRCKPGDLALINHPGPELGKMIEVMYLAPMGIFVLPDGANAVCNFGDCLVIRNLSSPFGLEAFRGSRKSLVYASVRDKWLTPIRGDENLEIIRDEELTHV